MAIMQGANKWSWDFSEFHRCDEISEILCGLRGTLTYFRDFSDFIDFLNILETFWHVFFSWIQSGDRDGAEYAAGEAAGIVAEDATAASASKKSQNVSEV